MPFRWQHLTLSLLASLLCGVSPAGAGTIYVNADCGDDAWSGSDPCCVDPTGPKQTIQAAINAAAHGDLVVIADGAYTGIGNGDISFLGKAITVRSAMGPQNCIIDCQNTTRGFVFDQGEGPDSVLDGLTIANGWHTHEGGAVYVFQSDPNLRNCVFTNNAAGQFGVGGAVFAGSSDLTISHCVFSDNATGEDGVGGAIYMVGGNPAIDNCVFTANSARWAGGVGGSSTDSLTVTDSIFMDNSALQDGGATGTLLVDVTLRNCIFAGNYAALSGGAVYAGGESSFLSVVNCTFSANSCPAGGGAGVAAPAVIAAVSNCIFWDAGPEIADFSGTVIYSNVNGGWAGVGNIDLDPLFADAGAGDYHLKSQAGRWDPGANSGAGAWILDDVTSPCIDAGDPADSVAQETMPHGARVNMGAYGGTTQASRGSAWPQPWNHLTQCHGDGDGDGDVDTLDWPTFRDALESQYPEAKYNSAGDYDRDGDVDTVDWPRFRDNFGKTSVPPDCGVGGTWPPANN